MAFMKDYQTRTEAAKELRNIADSLEAKEDGQYVTFKVSVVFRTLEEIYKMQMRSTKKQKVEVNA